MLRDHHAELPYCFFHAPCPPCWRLFCFLKIYLYLFMIEREREGKNLKQTPRWGWSPKQGLISSPWDHDLSQNQESNRLSNSDAPETICLERPAEPPQNNLFVCVLICFFKNRTGELHGPLPQAGIRGGRTNEECSGTSSPTGPRRQSLTSNQEKCRERCAWLPQSVEVWLLILG